MYLETGNRLFEEGKYVDAALNYQKALQRDAKFAEAHYRLGLTWLKQSKYREALDEFSQASELDPANEGATSKLVDMLVTAYLQDSNRPEFLYKRLTQLSERAFKQNARSFEGFRIQGYLKMTDNKSEESAKAFKQTLEIRPADPDMSLAIMKPLLDLKQPAEAEKIILTSIEKHKDVGALYDALYLLYLSQNRGPDAEKILRTLVQNNPTNTDFALQLCSYYYQQKNYSELTSVIQKVLSDPKGHPDGPLKVGEFYARHGDWKEAMAQVEVGLRTQPDQKAAYQRLQMNILVAQKKPDEALAIANSILKEKPQDREALAIRGAISLLTPSKLDEAQKDFRTLVDISPKDPVFRFRLGRIYQYKGDAVKAKAEFNEATKLRANYLPPRMGLAEISFNQRDYKGASGYLTSILKYDPHNPEVRVMMAAATMGLGKYDQAHSDLTAVLKDFPKYPPAEVQLAYSDLNQKHYREAEAVFRKHYHPGSKDLRPLNGLVEINIAEGHGSAALDLIRAEVKNSTPGARELLTTTAIRTGQFNVAVEELKKFSAEYPNSWDVEARLGDAYRMAGDTTNAIAHFQKAVDMAPKQVLPMIMLGGLLATSGRAQEAKARYEQALAIAPDDPIVLNNLASMLADNGGDLATGMKHAQRALAKDPDNPHVKDTVGWIYAKMNNSDSAIQILDGLTRKYPKDPTYHYHLGYAMLKKGQKEQAKTHLSLALSNGPAKEDEAEIKKLLASM